MLNNEPEHEPIGRISSKCNYDPRFIKQVVKEVEEGLPRQAACHQYQLKYGTLQNWIEKHGSLSMRKKQWSVASKRTVVRAVTQGRMSIKEALVSFNIRHSGTIKEWIQQYGQENDELEINNQSIVDNKPKEDTSGKDLQADNEVLKKALAEAQLKIAALNTLIDVAEEQLKINIRKKPGAKQ